MIGVSAAKLIWLSWLFWALPVYACTSLIISKLLSHIYFLSNSFLGSGFMKNSGFCSLLLTPFCVALCFGESLYSLLWVSFQVDFTGVQCPSSDGFWSFLFPKAIVGASGDLPAADCPYALYHKTNAKRLGRSPIFSLPHLHFSLPVTSPVFERLWYFESKPHPPLHSLAWPYVLCLALTRYISFLMMKK